jgi:hypothetical protein
MSIRTQTQPSLTGYPSANFDGGAFDALLWQKGYKVMHEEARSCPCRSRDSGSPLITCQNCRGFGQTFINPIETKAVISNINQNPKYVAWSMENAGTIMATLMNVNFLADFDRITFTEVTSKWSEDLKVRTVDGQMFVFLTYKPTAVIDVFVLESDKQPLIKLTPTTDYIISTTNGYILLLNFVPLVGFNGMVSVTYYCNPSYHVIDQPHNLRASTAVNQWGQIEKVDLPVQAVMRKAHLVLGLSDFEGGITTIDNSYK